MQIAVGPCHLLYMVIYIYIYMCTDARSADQHLGDTRPGIDVDIQLQLLADEEPVCCPFV